ncbi:MAG: DsrE family protein, partial [Dehalococcoidia bacterium]|nr:DsrE family protein [Dehalococcoidia bacterium]
MSVPRIMRPNAVVERVRQALKPARGTSVLIILSHSPFDGDTTWNALRLAATLQEQGVSVRIFVMNDATDLIRQGAMPEGSEFDLQAMLRGLLPKGGRVKVCTTCVNRCGMH